MARKTRTSALVLGTMLVLGGIGGLLVNEWRSAHRLATLMEAEDKVVSIAPGQVNPALEGALVHLSGTPLIDGPPADQLLEVTAPGLRLDRVVEMYQWREKTSGSGDDRHSTHERIWAEGRIDSSGFHERVGHENPPAPPITSERLYPKVATIGSYALGRSLLEQLPTSRPVSLDESREVDGKALRPSAGQLWSGDPAAPEIGDFRVRFALAEAATLSLVGGLAGGTIDRWLASNGDGVALIQSGVAEASAMIGAARQENGRVTWALRVVLGLAIFIGLSIVIRRVARMVPLVGALAAKLLMPVAAVLALAVTLLTIALGWLIFRPLLSLGLVAAGLAALAALRWMRAGSAELDLAHADPPPPPPPAQNASR